ncbi:MAG: hypothetical protein ACOC1F_00295 [Myxococcota bacterium]
MAEPLIRRLPRCGLYRTTKALPGHEREVPAGRLVYFHNHSDAGLPRVIVPEHILCNRWHFHGDGIAFRARSWADTLHKLPAQGYYVLRSIFRFEGGAWPKGALVQLGYTRGGEPILFIAQRRVHGRENQLLFSDRGVRMPEQGLSGLQGPLTVYTDRGERLDDEDHASGA